MPESWPSTRPLRLRMHTRAGPLTKHEETSLAGLCAHHFSDVHGANKPWKDICGAGQGVGQIDRVASVAELAEQVIDEYKTAG